MSMRKIYREIARKNGVSVSEIKRDMQVAIAAAYANPNIAALSVQRAGSVPTLEEFISHCAEKVTAQSKKTAVMNSGVVPRNNKVQRTAFL